MENNARQIYFLSSVQVHMGNVPSGPRKKPDTEENRAADRDEEPSAPRVGPDINADVLQIDSVAHEPERHTYLPSQGSYNTSLHYQTTVSDRYQG